MAVAAARRRAGAAAVAAHALRAARRRHRRAGAAATWRGRGIRRRRPSAFLAVPDAQRGRVDRLLHRDLRRAGSVDPVPRVRSRSRRPTSPAGSAACSSIRGSGCSRTRRCWSPRRSGCSRWRARRGPCRLLRRELAVRRAAVPADRHALRDVVGRLQLAGAVPRAAAAVAGDPGRRGVGGRARAERARCSGGVAGRHRAASPSVLASVDRGRLAYFDRGDVYASWLEWASRTADLAHGLPAYFARVQRQRPGWLFYSEIAVWVGDASRPRARPCADRRRAGTDVGASRGRGGAGHARRRSAGGRRRWSRWRSCGGCEGVDGRPPASAAMNLLRQARRRRSRGRARSSPDDRGWRRTRWCGRMALRLARGAAHRAPVREDRALFTLPRGARRVSTASRTERSGGAGWLMAGVGVGRDQFALRHASRSSVFDRRGRGPLPGRRPRAGRARRRGCAAHGAGAGRARRVDLRSGTARLSDGIARRAVRYGGDVGVLHGRARLPGAGRLLGGRRARDRRRACSRMRPGPSLALLLRNAPIDNVVTLE